MSLLPTSVDVLDQSGRNEMDRLLTSPQLLRLDAAELADMMRAGSLTSTVLVESVLAQMDRFENGDTNLNAMLDVAPLEVVMKRAVELDSERRRGYIRGPLHGIPIIIKDCISTHPDLGMKTSIGSYALINSRPARSSTVVDRVPGGSSTGSAVGVSAGYSPITVAQETEGSIIQPAARAGLYAIKPTPGTIPSDGVWTISSKFDSLGPMAKSAHDLYDLYRALVEDESGQEIVPPLTSSGFQSLTVGFLDPEVWIFGDEYLHPLPGLKEQLKKTFRDTAAALAEKTAKAVFDVAIPLTGDLKIGELDAIQVVACTLDYNGRPFGLSVMAREGREDLLFAFMKAWEASFPWRPIPKMLDKEKLGSL
ncbi:hypothetical protein Daus18300_010449 [Diaporthe australafricana]|uniref:Amidase domain-containing protein n=1 Tax=Diaporthe australafricana TaxID=127596 RepID=A0ABR3WAH6_9PEZI